MTLVRNGDCSTHRQTQTTEEPKSASWIPSYSVRSQGSSPLNAPQPTAADADVAEIESLPEPVVEVEVPHEESPAPAAEVEAVQVTKPELSAPVAELEAVPEVAAEVVGEATPVIVTETADEVHEVSFTIV